MSTRAQLLAEVTTSFPNNTTGAITPAILSTQQNDVINSCWIPATDGTPLTGPALTTVNSITATAGNDLTLAAGATNQNVVLSPSGTGFVRAGATVTTETAGTVAWQFTGSINNFYQGVLQNTSALGTASTDLVIYNDQVSGANPTTHYLDLGKNSSGFSGAGPINIASGSYLYEQTDDLSVGTVANTKLHLFSNNAESVTIIGTNTLLGGLATNGTGVLQLPAATTSAGGIWLGTDVNFFRTAAGALTLTGAITTTDTIIIPNGKNFQVAANAGIGVQGAYFSQSASDNFSIVNAVSGKAIQIQALGAGSIQLYTNGTQGYILSSSQGSTFNGTGTFTSAARASGVASYLTVNIPADTGQTASTESIGYQHVTAIRTWATTGTVALQRENYFAGPTYASASASQTFTDAFNVYITPPVAGSNAIFTRGHSLGIVDSTSATTAITGGFVLATTLGTAATSIGMGGGNIVAGGNIFASTSTGRIGYLAGSGAGGAVTQITSRVTGVTLNTPTGQITLFAAAGSATAATFTVTCSAVAATDTIYLSQVSGTNLYETFVTAVGAGSFNITFFTTGGTASDSPVFNYTVVKGSAS